MIGHETGQSEQQDILIVDDTLATLEFLTRILADHGYRVRPACEGLLALRSVAAKDPDLILLDVKMPDMDGYEVCRRLKSDEQTRKVPVIFISALGETVDKVEGFNAGGVDYITKPFEPEEVLARVRTHLRLRELTERLEQEVREKTVDLATANQHLKLEIAEHERAEQALRESEERYRSLVENVDLGITLIDSSHRIMMTNAAQGRLFNKPESEFVGQECFREFEKRDAICPHCPGVKAMATGQRQEVETEVVRDDGSCFTVHIHAFPIYSRDGAVAGFIEMIEDITERKRLEDQLRQGQRLEAVGRLAGGIAHDFNNLLTVMLGYSDALRQRMPDNHPFREWIDEICTAAGRASDLTRQLLAFSRKQVLEVRVLNPNLIVSNLKKMLHRVVGEDVELIMDLDSKLDRVRADPGQVEQILMNLSVNARDAMPDGGKLILETSNVFLDEAYSGILGDVTPGKYVVLAVSDTGHGMDKDTLSRVFDPFFTTKEIHKGTGLGLSTVYGIVKQHGGYVSVYSEVGKGSTFRIYFPSVCLPLDGTPFQSASPSQPRGDETILVVEDEDNVRRLACAFLSTLGYAILSASDPKEAMAISDQHAGHIDLLFTDVVMPQMDGTELFSNLSTARPQLKVLYMSGYSQHAIVKRGVLKRGIHFLPKPFTIDSVAKKVREALDDS